MPQPCYHLAVKTPFPALLRLCLSVLFDPERSASPPSSEYLSRGKSIQEKAEGKFLGEGEARLCLRVAIGTPKSPALCDRS